jgi:hypothetical protein
MAESAVTTWQVDEFQIGPDACQTLVCYMANSMLRMIFPLQHINVTGGDQKPS